MQTMALLTLVLLAAGAALAAPAVPVDEAEAGQWQRWLLPLPKKVDLQAKVTLPVSALRLRLPQGATEAERCAVEGLAGALKEASGVAVPPGGRGFAIRFERGTAGGDFLGYLPNADQAYAIETVHGGGGVSGLRCSTLTEVGTCYAARTLRQLLVPRVHGKGSAATVDVPAGRIVDWPDLEERGEWGGTAWEDLEWMAAGKFNVIEAHAKPAVDAQGVGHATIDPKLMERGRKHAVRIVPIIHHLEQIADSGIFQAYPQLRGVAAPESICFARPEIVTLVGQWLAELGKTPGVFDVMIWLSEEGKGCECPECAKHDRFVNETRACLAAWEQAKRECPRLGLRLLLTQASYPSNAKVLAAVPEGVKVSYYHGGLTYDTTRRPMIYPLIEDYVRKGRWMGVYPTVSANWLIVGPFSNPPFVHTRMNEFVSKGLRCLVAYAVPSNAYYRANVEAAMEWSWNARGRSPREFALAYAVRHGIKDPVKYAEWTEALSPVSWDVYGSSFPYAEHWGGTDRIARGGAKLGEGIFFEFKREEQLDEDLAKCRAALALAEASGDATAVLETRILDGYVKVLRSVWELSKTLKGRQALAGAERDAAERWFGLFDEGCTAVVDLYPKWSDTLLSPTGATEPGRFTDTVQTMDRLAGRMGALMEQYGLADPKKAYRIRLLGQWKSEEFLREQAQVRRFDLTDLVDGPGVFEFRPKYTSGTLGLGVTRAALVSFPKDNPAETREEAVDEHEAHVGSWVKGEVFRLDLEAHDPERSYALLASVHGGQTTNGEFYFRKAKQ